MMAMLLLTAVVGCIQKVPPDVVEAIDALDRQLIESQGVEYAPDAYARFIKHWVALRGRLQAEEDEIVWPWEENPMLTALQQVRAEGEEAIAQSQERREARRLEAESRLVLLEGRLRASIAESMTSAAEWCWVESRWRQLFFSIRRARFSTKGCMAGRCMSHNKPRR